VVQVVLFRSQPSIAAQLLPSQQGSPELPQAQRPFSQPALPGHVATQVPPCVSQQPDEHEPPGQHGSPAPPQARQTSLSQAKPEAVQLFRSQQGCPPPPQATHCPP
jgi:hypothetical protein